MIKIRFTKLANKWFADIPMYEGDVNDLQMVSGADTLIELYALGKSECEVGVLDDFDWDDYNSDPSLIVLKKTVETEGYGATYDVTSRLYRDEVWLCPVMLHVFGEYPDELKIIIYKTE